MQLVLENCILLVLFQIYNPRTLAKYLQEKTAGLNVLMSHFTTADYEVLQIDIKKPINLSYDLQCNFAVR